MSARTTLLGILRQWTRWADAAHETPEAVADAHAAEVRAEAFREAADRMAVLLAATPEYGPWVAEQLRAMADDTAPPSALRQAHAALAAQADRDQAAIERVRQAIAPYDWLHAQIPAASIRRALDPQEPTP